MSDDRRELRVIERSSVMPRTLPVVAPRTCDAQIQEFIRAPMVARHNVLNRGLTDGLPRHAKVQLSTAVEAFPAEHDLTP